MFFPYRLDQAASTASMAEPLSEGVSKMRSRLAAFEERLVAERADRERLDAKRQTALASRRASRLAEAKASTSRGVEAARARMAAYDDAVRSRALQVREAEDRVENSRLAARRQQAAADLEARRADFQAQVPAVRSRLAAIDAKHHKAQAKTNDLLRDLGCITAPAAAA